MAQVVDRWADQEMIRADVRPEAAALSATSRLCQELLDQSSSWRQLWRSFPVLFALRIVPMVRMHS